MFTAKALVVADILDQGATMVDHRPMAGATLLGDVHAEFAELVGVKSARRVGAAVELGA